MKLEKIHNIISEYEKHPWYSDLQLAHEKHAMEDLKEDLENYRPKIVVMGEFSAGKSTVINALLQEDILPAEFQPTTAFLTEINYSHEKYIRVNGEKKELLKENIGSIDNINDKKIDILLDAPLLKEFSLIDTPGTNDPSKFTDDLVFSLVGEADVIMFVMNSNQALKNTEKQFISKLIKEKDIGKFFFILNWADTIENPKIVKNETIDQLATLLHLDKDIIKQQTFIYSAKEALTTILAGKEDNRHNLLVENICEFIHVRKNELLNLWLENETSKIISSILLKAETLEDSILGNTQKYEIELTNINEEMKTFELAIAKELIEFESSFKSLQYNYKNSVRDAIRFVLGEIKKEVESRKFDELVGSRFIELRTKKLVEDKLEECTTIFLENIKKLITDFDTKIINTLTISSNVQFTPLSDAGTSKKVVNTTALIATGLGAVSIAPTAAGIVGGGAALSGLAALGPMMVAIPVVGPFLAVGAAATAVAVPIIGIFAVSAGKVLFDVGKWGVNIVGDMATKVEEKARKIQYVTQVEKSLKTLESAVLSNIDQIKVDDFKDNYIHGQFPQRTVLEEKIKILHSQQIESMQVAKEEAEGLATFKNEFLKI